MMKTRLQRAISVLLLIFMLVSVSIPVCAEPSRYSATSNSGTRNEICTTLDGTGAEDYYTGNYEYDKLDDLSSSALLTALRQLMTDTHEYETSYNDCKNYSDQTDCENGNGKVVLLYTSYSATMGDWLDWNREHVWPKSLGGFGTSRAGSDLHHIRPADQRVNSTRSNNKYGEVSGGKNAPAGEWINEISGGTHGGGYFEPHDNVKGDVARICLYIYARWGSTYSQCSKITNVFQSVDVLLDWCELDPVDTWEMGRNEVVEGIQGNRNVFIDYPELAWLLFDREIPDDMVTPSGEAKNGSSSDSGNTDEPDTPPTVDPPVVDPVDPPVIPPVVEPDEDDASLAIVSNNALFGEKLSLMYAVRAEGLMEGQTLSVILCDQSGKQIATTTSRGVANVNGEQLPTFVSDRGLPMHNIDTVIYAKVQVLEGDTVVMESAPYEYSLLEYLYERLYVSSNVSDAQRALYNALIKYAKAADLVLNKDDSIAQTAYVRVNADGGIYRVGDVIYPESNLIVGNGERLVWTVVTPTSTTKVDAGTMENGYTVTEGYNFIVSSVETVPTQVYYCDYSGFKNNTSYTKQTSDGWQATNAAVVAVVSNSPAVVINGKTTAKGKLTSPTLDTGLSYLTFQYGNPYSETNGVDITVNVYQNGQIVASMRLDNNSVDQKTAYTFEWELDSAIKGEFTIEIVNNSPTNSTSNKDRVGIWDISWIGA